MLIHVLRAADILDFLEEFDIIGQAIRHNSSFSGIIIISMHWIVDIFLLSAFVRWGKRYFLEEKFDFEWHWGKMSFIVFFYFVYTNTNNWSMSDTLIFWFLDNIYRVIDVGDTFQIFNWSLHNAEKSIMSSCMALLFRAYVFVIIGKGISRLAERLGDRGQGTSPLNPFSRKNLPLVINIVLLVTIIFVVEVKEPFPRIQKQLDNDDSYHRTGAAKAMEFMGDKAIPSLLIAYVDSNQEVREAAERSLRGIDRNWYVREETKKFIDERTKFLISGDDPMNLMSLVMINYDVKYANYLAIQRLHPSHDVRRKAQKNMQSIKWKWEDLTAADTRFFYTVNNALTSNSDDRKLHALKILKHTPGERPRNTIDVLLKCLNDRTFGRWAMRALCSAKPLEKDVISRVLNFHECDKIAIEMLKKNAQEDLLVPMLILEGAQYREWLDEVYPQWYKNQSHLMHFFDVLESEYYDAELCKFFLDALDPMWLKQNAKENIPRLYPLVVHKEKTIRKLAFAVLDKVDGKFEYASLSKLKTIDLLTECVFGKSKSIRRKMHRILHRKDKEWNKKTDYLRSFIISMVSRDVKSYHRGVKYLNKRVANWKSAKEALIATKDVLDRTFANDKVTIGKLFLKEMNVDYDLEVRFDKATKAQRYSMSLMKDNLLKKRLEAVGVKWTSFSDEKNRFRLKDYEYKYKNMYKYKYKHNRK
ncbi:HEAT repeat domain-containing protein [Candidatus Uabimicrobium amorphum]|uniref:HEAT repeat domain-containing protein n=1 Tax=Uabimicrobium amorphum TaxID=2596890 RepID=UPI00125F5FB3|nr:HEAT repeat domain-containing protein [Candidatus Uabimicrobium amorphum]